MPFPFTPQLAVPQMFDPAAGTGSDDTVLIQAAVDMAFGTAAAPHGMSSWQNVPLYFPPAPSSYYKVAAPIVFPPIFGGLIYGNGPFASNILTTSIGGVFAFKSLADVTVRGLWFKASDPTATLIDHLSDNTVFASQRCTFENLYFQDGAIGLSVKAVGNGQASEYCFESLWATGSVVAGLKISSFNALGHRVEGGNFQSCGTGILVESGTTHVWGSAFQGSTVRDIDIEASANDTVIIEGIRSESKNFVVTRAKRPAVIIGCSHMSADPAAKFFEGDAPADITGSTAVQGTVTASAQGGSIRSSSFGRDDPFSADFPGTTIGLDHVRIGKTWLGSGTGTPRLIERGRYVHGFGFLEG